MSSPSPSGNGSGSVISIDVANDLDSPSDLRRLLSADRNVLMQFGEALAQYAGQPVSSAVGALFVPTLSLTAALPSWTAGPVTFSLTPTATCTLTIAAKGEPLNVATKVDDTASTADVQMAPAPGMTYINIDLDFTLEGNASGSGTAYGVSISGKASGSAATTLSFCQPVPSNTLTLDALKLAFSQVVFPTGTGSLGRMIPGSSCRMNFDGSLNLGVTASYGLGPFMLSAASAAGVVSSIEQVVPAKITLPTAQVSPLATASVTYAHTDHFGLVLEKQDANTALLYIIRSATNEFGENLGITVGVQTTAASVALDAAQIQQKVQDITRSAKLAGEVGAAVSQPLNNLLTAKTAELNAWIANANGNSGLSVALAQQTGRSTLFNYSVDLAQAGASQSWDDLLSHSLPEASTIPGFTLLAGSGVAEQLKRSATLQFNIFNLYNYSSVTNFFDNSTSELAADGTIRLVSNIGIEQLVSTNSASDTMRFHFTSTATQDVLGDISKAEIDLHIEISEKNDPNGAAELAKLLGMVEPGLPAIQEMNDYATGNPGGTLGLVAVVKQNAYAALRYSPYTPGIDGKPPADQTEDRNNWNVIHRAAATLMPTAASALVSVTYDNWSKFNSICNTGNQNSLPDRRHGGNTSAVPRSFWPDPGRAGFFSNFFIESARGMNLVEDLVTLANNVANATTAAQWALIQSDVASIVKDDFYSDYSKPIAAAILSMAVQGTTKVTASTAKATDASTFTTTLTLAHRAAAGAASGSVS